MVSRNNDSASVFLVGINRLMEKNGLINGRNDELKND